MPTPPLPANTPKKTGLGCGAVALLLLPLGLGGLALSALLDAAGGGVIGVAAAGVAIGSLCAVFGVGMLRQGRRIDALMSGEGLLARWDYKQDSGSDGFVFVGRDGVYHNGVYTEWSRGCVLEGVELTQDAPRRLIFRHTIRRRNSSLPSTAATRKKLQVPVPVGKEGDAQRVVEHVQQSRPS